MEIVKQLNLNRNNQVVPNGSLVYAKNIKASNDSSFITNDNGFGLTLQEAETINELKVQNIDIDFSSSNIFGTVVGYINCPNEIVVFTYTDGQNPSSNIFRLIESKDGTFLNPFIVYSGWHYSGGNIRGSYYYNFKKELIVIIAESKEDAEIPLKFINLNTSTENDDESSYYVAPYVPIANCVCNKFLAQGNIDNGVYNFFIRYKIAEDYYTKWFPIGVPYYVTNTVDNNIIKHYALNRYNSSENKSIFNINITTNDLKDKSNVNLRLLLSFDDTLFYERYQIGFIVNTDAGLFGRIWREFDINTKELIFDGYNTEEGIIDDFIESPFNIYNVKALDIYDNKLYVGNYSETDYNDEIDDSIINKIIPNYSIKQILVDNSSVEIINNSYIYHTISCGSYSASYQYASDRVLTLYDIWGDAFVSVLRYALNTENTDILNVNAKAEIQIKLGNTWRNLLQVKFTKDNSTNNNLVLYWTNEPNIHYSTWDIRRSSYPSSVLHYDSTRKIKYNYKTVQSTVEKPHNDIPSLDEGEVYSFFVHYVRRDGSYTNGYPIENNIATSDNDASAPFAGHKEYELTCQHAGGDVIGLKSYITFENNNGRKLCKVGNSPTGIDNNKRNVIYPRFSNVEIPDGYVGVFFSYEKVQPTKLYEAYCKKVTDITENNNTYYIYKLKSFVPEKVLSGYRGDFLTYKGTDYKIYDSKIKLSDIYDSEVYYSTFGEEGGVFVKLDSELPLDTSYLLYPTKNVVSIHIFNKSIYTNNKKELISFGYIRTDKTEGTYNTETEDDFNLPNIVQLQETLVVRDMNATFTGADDTGSQITVKATGFVINSNNTINFANKDGNVDTEDYVLKNNGAYKLSGYYTKINFATNDRFYYRAISIKKEPDEVVQDINYGNSNFTRINKYVTVTNLSDLLEYKLWYTNVNVKIYTDINSKQRQIKKFPNGIRWSYSIADENIENKFKNFNSAAYKLMDLDKGEILNLQAIAKNLIIHTTNTLVIATSDSKITADNTTIGLTNYELFDLKPTELFSSDLGYGGIKYSDCVLFCSAGYIWYDTDHNKLFKFDGNNFTDLTTDIEELVKYYNYEKCFINVDNTDNRLFFCFVKDNNILTLSYNTIINKFISTHSFKFDKSYHTTDKIYFGNSGVSEIYKYDLNSVSYENLAITNSLFNNDYLYCFDIIFNSNYNSPKVLECINWVHEIINKTIKFDSNFMDFASNNGSKYKDDLYGVKLQVYTDRTHTELIDLHVDDSDIGQNVLQTSNNYKDPWYDKGVWHFNYFRAIPNGKASIENPQIDIYGNIIDGSDNRTLIHGKYIVVRFVFNLTADVMLKFDNIELTLNRY